MGYYTEGVEVPPHSRDDFRVLAGSVRKKFGISDADPFPVVEFLEFALPELYNDFEYEIASRADMGTNHGITYPDKHRILIREDVYFDAIAGKGRDRFTVAHEIGHQLAHEGIPLSLARRNAGDLPLYRNSEWQADCFAGELLMPYEAIRSMDAPSVSRIYQVSMSAVRTQFKAALGRR